MDWKIALLVTLSIILAGFTFWAALFSRPRRIKGWESLVACALGASVYALGQALALKRIDLPGILFWSALGYGGVALASTAWFFLALEQAQKHVWGTPRGRALLLAMPLLVVAAALSNPWHHLFWSRFNLVELAGRPGLQADFGVLFWLLGLTTAVLLLAGSGLLLLLRFKSIIARLLLPDITEARHTEEQLRRREHYLTLLNDITRAAVAAADFSAMLQILADRMGQLIDADGCYVMLWDESTRTVIPSAAYGKHRDSFNAFTFPPGEVNFASTVLDQGRPLAIEEAANSPLIAPQLLERFPSRSLLVLPLIAGMQKLGAAVIAFEQPHHFTPDEIERGEQASAQIALVIAQARYLDAQQRSAHQLELLYDVSRQIAATLDEKEIFQRTVELLVKHFGFAAAAIGLVNPQNEIEAVVVAGTQDLGIRPGFTIKIGQGVAGRAAEKRAAYVTNDISQDQYYFTPGSATTGSAMGLPLLWEEALLGVIYIESSQRNAFTSNELHVFETLAAHVATATENARLYANVRKRLREMTALQSLSRVIASSLVLDEIFKTVVSLIHDIFSYSHVSIYQLYGDTLHLKAQAGYHEALMISEIPIDTGVSGRAVRTRQMQFVADASADSDFLRADPAIRSELCIPLLREETVFGTLNVESGPEHPLTESDIDLMNILAAQVTVAIDNASLYQIAQRQAQEAEMLRKATAALTSALDLQKVLGNILIHLEEVIPYDSASVQLLGEGYLEIVGGRGWADPSIVVGLRFAVPGDNPNSVVIQQRQPYILNNANRSYPEFKKDPHSHIQSWLGVPLLIQEKVIGMLALDSIQPRYFTVEHARLVATFADQVVIALENARLYQSARRSAERWAILYRVTQEVVAASLNSEEIYTTIHRAVAQLMPCEAFAIGLLDEIRQDINGVYAYDIGGRYPSLRVPIEGSLSGHIITSGKSVYIPDFNGDEQVSSIHFGQEEEVRSILAVPLVLRNRAFGMLSTQSYKPNAYSADDLELLEMLAAHISAAIENARLFTELQRLAITDPMTGVYNLRGLFDLGHREVDRARRFHHPLSVLFFDIDYFKQVNDLYRDHTIGDQVLNQLAECCRRLIREVDILGRYGGEEFVIVLPETDILEAQGVAERLRLAVADTPMPTDRGPVYITISLGVVGAKENLPDFEALVDQADTAMYTAKQAGRNQVVVFEG